MEGRDQQQGGAGVGVKREREPEVVDLTDVPDGEVQISPQDKKWLCAIEAMEKLWDEPSPSYINVQLKHYQKVAVDFMKNREDGNTSNAENYPRGGILGDEMGLGKTLTTLALIATQKRIAPSGAKTGPTLIVVPKSISSQWVREITSRIDGLSVLKYIESKHRKALNAAEPGSYDIVVSTYSRVSTDYQKGDQPLSKIEWQRIVYDEFTELRNSDTAKYRACFGIRAPHVWGLSGTVVVNDLQDLRNCVKMICGNDERFDWMLGLGKRIKLPNGSFRDSTTLAHITKSRLMVRRTKETQFMGQPILVIPPLVRDEIPRVALNDFEKGAYGCLLDAANELIEQKLEEAEDEAEEGAQGRVVMFILLLLLRVRMACNSFRTLPNDILALCSPKHFNRKKLVAALRRSLDKNSGVDPDDGVFDETDSEDEYEAQSLSATNEDPEFVEFMEDVRKPSSKTEAVIANIERMRSENGGKVLVFSSFRCYHDILAEELGARGVSTLQFDGRLSAGERDEVLEKFKASQMYNVLLITFKVGSLGLNITEAQNVIIVDPWWHAADEEQAVARAHRLGQHNEVHWCKTVVAKTVEERIIDLQNHKTALSRTVMGSLDEDMVPGRPRMDLDELLSLFRGFEDE